MRRRNPAESTASIVAPEVAALPIIRPAEDRSGRRTTVLAVRRALIAVAISVATVVMLAAPASAHAVLVETVPAASQVYSKAPQAVVLRFNEPVQVALGGVRLFDSTGHRILT